MPVAYRILFRRWVLAFSQFMFSDFRLGIYSQDPYLQNSRPQTEDQYSPVLDTLSRRCILSEPRSTNDMSRPHWPCHIFCKPHAIGWRWRSWNMWKWQQMANGRLTSCDVVASIKVGSGSYSGGSISLNLNRWGRSIPTPSRQIIFQRARANALILLQGFDLPSPTRFQPISNVAYEQHRCPSHPS